MLRLKGVIATTPCWRRSLPLSLDFNPHKIIQNGDRTWKRYAAFGDPLQVVPHGQLAVHKYSYHCQGSNRLPALNTHRGELREKSA